MPRDSVVPTLQKVQSNPDVMAPFVNAITRALDTQKVPGTTMYTMALLLIGFSAIANTDDQFTVEELVELQRAGQAMRRTVKARQAN